MNAPQFLENFSKLSKNEKMEKIDSFLHGNALAILKKFQFQDNSLQQLVDEISENAIASYPLPYSIAPNFLINGKIYHIPMVIEESSVVAAASWSAKFWAQHGGFQAKVISTTKSGQIHIIWPGKKADIEAHWEPLKASLLQSVAAIAEKMELRGGGIKNVQWNDNNEKIKDYHEIHVTFETKDAMGANFINSCLESMSVSLRSFLVEKFPSFPSPLVVMSILSNHIPECVVECNVSCNIDALEAVSNGLGAQEFARKFEYAVKIAHINVHRAVTHNKGIFNGIDAVALATANDFRAIEAGGHAYASLNGQYQSLSEVQIENGNFSFILKISLAVGTVGGLVSVHPLAKLSMEILGKPNAQELMQIMAAAGLANNFSAVRALVTSGIQQGHMKLHLPNILSQLHASEEEKLQAAQYFKGKVISFAAVESFLKDIRK